MNFLELPKTWYAKAKNFTVNFIDSFKKNLQRPNFLANSNAVGVFCALVPTIGQGYLCFLLWLLFRKFKSTQFSLAISVAWTVITNPLTMPFVLYGYYKVGSWCIARDSITFEQFITQAKDIIRTSTNWESAIKEGMHFAFDDIGSPMLIGAGVCIVVITIIAYFLTYFIASYMAKRRTQKRFFNF